MDLTKKVQRILPLSAASVALLQSTSPSVANPAADAVILPGKREYEASTDYSKTDGLILSPAQQDELLKMYADHSSHASHASHASHYSGAGGGGGYVDPSISTTPATPTAPTYPQYGTTREKAKPRVIATNAVPETNSVATTNGVAQASAAEDAANVEALKKQAAAGSADAQFTLGLYYYYGGHGLTKSEERAKMLIEMSATQGNSMAQNWLTQHTDQTDKIEKDTSNTSNGNSTSTP